MGSNNRRSPGRSSFGKGQLFLAALLAVASLATFYGSRDEAPGDALPVSVSPRQEIALGLQAAPEMARRYGGLHPNQRDQERVDEVCSALVTKTEAAKTPYEFECHVLADERTADAFVLPGGQVFLTAGLLRQLETEGQLAGVLGTQSATSWPGMASSTSPSSAWARNGPAPTFSPLTTRTSRRPGTAPP